MRSINSFSEAVHRLARARGMKLEDVAAGANYSPSYLSKMLHGHRRLLPAVVTKIDKALGAGGELERIAQAQEAACHTPPRPMQLPPAAACFVGRDEYLHQLDEALITQNRPGVAVTVVIEGGFWVGKTELALQWAARVEHRFPGGCLYADLRGLAPGIAADPNDVLEAFLHALGAGNSAKRGTLSDRAALYRSLLAQRPAVVVLDNVADYEQVRHLLPGAGSTVVTTSREHQRTLLLRSGGLQIDLPPLSLQEALTLLRQRVGDALVNAEPVAAKAVVRRCGLLPTAVLIAAEHVRQRYRRSLATLADDLAVEERRLDLFTSPDAAVNIHSVLDLSYLALPALAKRVFRLLGISPAHLISTESAAAAAGLTVEAARPTLEALRQTHLLDEDADGRLRMNHLVRAYASKRAFIDEPLSEVERARDRVLAWYTATAWHAGNTLAPRWAGSAFTPEPDSEVEPLTFAESGYDGAIAWCDTEVKTAVHVARHARGGRGRDAGWMLPALFLPYFYVTKNWGMWLTAATEGLAAARNCGSPQGIAWSLHSLGWVQHELGRTEEALERLSEAFELRAELGNDDRLIGWVSVTFAAALLSAGRRDEAQARFELAEKLFSKLDFDFGLAFTRAVLAHAYQAAGDDDAADQCALSALENAKRSNATPALSLAHHQYGLLLLRDRRHRVALGHLDAALKLRCNSRERRAEAETLIAYAETLSAMDKPLQARESYTAAAGILNDLRDPRALDLHARVAALNAHAHSSDS
ncbi:helix-turn-helix domain-containing protein [Amycolatopsis sp. NPDC059657]|uniref:helix-turn-helix domain-containing protein n=1 Tax=Amycolatopsis sp. NPDC059657 TaxID=3346899 RepID=UPI00367155E4